MNISSEVWGRHTVGDKTCDCRLSAYDTYLFYPQCLCLLPFYSRKIQKKLYSQKAGLLTCPLYPESPSHSSNSGFVDSETTLYECF